MHALYNEACLPVHSVILLWGDFIISQVSLPDSKTETLGLNVLDEPRAKQSDPTVLDLQLRTVAKHSTVKPMVRYHTRHYAQSLVTSKQYIAFLAL